MGGSAPRQLDSKVCAFVLCRLLFYIFAKKRLTLIRIFITMLFLHFICLHIIYNFHLLLHFIYVFNFWLLFVCFAYIICMGCLLLICKNSLYIRDINVFCLTYILQIFSPVCGLYFVFVFVLWRCFEFLGMIRFSVSVEVRIIFAFCFKWFTNYLKFIIFHWFNDTFVLYFYDIWVLCCILYSILYICLLYFLILGSVDILGPGCSLFGARLSRMGVRGCPTHLRMCTASPTSIHQMPVAPHPSDVTIKNVSRHCQMSSRCKIDPGWEPWPISIPVPHYFNNCGFIVYFNIR